MLPTARPDRPHRRRSSGRAALADVGDGRRADRPDAADGRRADRRDVGDGRRADRRDDRSGSRRSGRDRRDHPRPSTARLAPALRDAPHRCGSSLRWRSSAVAWRCCWRSPMTTATTPVGVVLDDAGHVRTRRRHAHHACGHLDGRAADDRPFRRRGDDGGRDIAGNDGTGHHRGGGAGGSRRNRRARRRIRRASEDTTATESSPPGTVEYDLSIDPTCTIGQTLRRGDTGPQVECLQERLNEITVGGTSFAVDGAFGEQTEEAVRAFQAAQQLGVDGIVGPTTGGALGIWPE